MTRPVLTVRQIMQAEPVTVDAACALDVVLGLMNLHRIGAVIVIHPDRSLAGIFTDRDLLRRVGVADSGWQTLPVSEWMTTNPYWIPPEASWDEAVGMMDRLRVRHLPVLEDQRVIGIVSGRMLMHHRTEYLNGTIERRTLELQHAYDELLGRDAELRHNLRVAGRLQKRLLLPPTLPDWPQLRWGTHFAPLDHLGGDYYDIAQPDADHLGFLIADASGHSVAAGMVAIMSRIGFTEIAGRTIRPGEVLATMNERLLGMSEDRFVTAFYGVLDRRTRVLTYANAGHPYPLRFSSHTGDVQTLSAQGFLLGIMPGEQYRDREVTLEPGDRLCFFTDGLVEARNEIGETYGMERLRACFTAHGNDPPDVITRRIIESQCAFRESHALNDDVTLVVAELRTP